MRCRSGQPSQRLEDVPEDRLVATSEALPKRPAAANSARAAAEGEVAGAVFVEHDDLRISRSRQIGRGQDRPAFSILSRRACRAGCPIRLSTRSRIATGGQRASSSLRIVRVSMRGRLSDAGVQGVVRSPWPGPGGPEQRGVRGESAERLHPAAGGAGARGAGSCRPSARDRPPRRRPRRAGPGQSLAKEETRTGGAAGVRVSY